MTIADSASPRERILQAALALLETGGVSAVSTRAVSSAAEVQVPTIYRQFGDMQGLLGEVASAGFDIYLRHKTQQPVVGDPVEQLREGWNRHVQFGLDHPHLYTLIHAGSGGASSGAGSIGPASTAAQEARAMLRALLVRVAEAGRLALGVERAAELINAACRGLTLSLIGSAGLPGDGGNQTGLADLMRETVFSAVLTPETRIVPDDSTARQRAAGHAAALDALLPGLNVPFSTPERALFSEWLHRLS